MVNYAMFTSPGGRSGNEDYIAVGQKGEDYCFVLCDGLGGHERGEVASEYVASRIVSLFEEEGDSADFFDKAFISAQEGLLKLQEDKNIPNGMKTTAVVLVITEEQIKWAHIGDSRLYHFFDNGKKYERTKDHSLVQMMRNSGEITEEEMKHHPDRNKVFRVVGAEWGKKSYEKSAILERESGHSFLLMSDGCWEYIANDEMAKTLRYSIGARGWMKKLIRLVRKRADMKKTDNYSIIAVRI